jgi:excisionase family DNA binding protein
MTALPKTCLSVADAAKFLGVSAVTVRRLIKKKKLRASKIGRRIVVSPAALGRYLDENPA